MTASANTTAQIASNLRYGCYSRISQSSGGQVAYVAGSSVVNITKLTCLDGEAWDFCAPYSLYPTDLNNNPTPISFLSWCPSASDLAVADENGHLSIYTQSPVEIGAMQKQPIQRTSTQVQQPLEMNRIIGFKWFDTNNPITLTNPPVIQQKAFQAYAKDVDNPNIDHQFARYSFFSINQFGPYVPMIPDVNKKACVALTRRGDIRLFTQDIVDGKYIENSYHIDRDGIAQEAVVFSHASFSGCKSANDDTLLLSAYSSETETLFIYKLIIEWPALSALAGGAKFQDLKGTPLSKLKVQRVLRQKIIPPVNPSLYVSHIHLMPPGPKRLDTLVDAELQIAFSAPDTTVIQKFLIITRKLPNIHNVFFKSMDNGSSLQASLEKVTTLLVPSENVVTCRNTIIGIGSTNFDSYFYTCFADGTIEIRFRTQYAEENPVSSSALLSLHIAGFNFPPMATVDELCLSHNMCSALYIKDGKLEISYACNTKLPQQKIEQPKSDTFYQLNLLMMLSAVTLAARHAMAGFHFCCDDLYILMKQTYDHLNKISPKVATLFYRILIRESYRSIHFPIDSLPIDQNTKSVSSMNLGRVFTMKAVLGTHTGWKKDHMARVAWSELNLRNLVFAFSFTLKEYSKISKRSHENRQNAGAGSSLSLNDVEECIKCIGSILSLLRFLIDLVAFICQELYVISLHPDPYEYIANRKTVAVPLLLGTLSRVLLLTCFRVIKYLELFAGQNIEHSIGTSAEKSSQHLYKQLRDITRIVSPVKIEEFEHFLSKVQSLMEEAYPTLANKHQIEEDLAVSATVHPDLKGVLTEVVSFFSKNILPNINVSWLHFYDVEWLGISDDVTDDEVSYYVGDKKIVLQVSNSLDNMELGGGSMNNLFNGSSTNTDENSANGQQQASASSNYQKPNQRSKTNGSAASTAATASIKKKAVHPHPSAFRQGTEIDYVLKKQMSPKPRVGTRSRCARCGEIMVWNPNKPGARSDWEGAFLRSCFCGGGWIKADY